MDLVVAVQEEVDGWGHMRMEEQAKQGGSRPGRSPGVGVFYILSMLRVLGFGEGETDRQTANSWGRQPEQMRACMHMHDDWRAGRCGEYRGRPQGLELQIRQQPPSCTTLLLLGAGQRATGVETKNQLRRVIFGGDGGGGGVFCSLSSPVVCTFFRFAACHSWAPTFCHNTSNSSSLSLSLGVFFFSFLDFIRLLSPSENLSPVLCGF